MLQISADGGIRPNRTRQLRMAKENATAGLDRAGQGDVIDQSAPHSFNPANAKQCSSAPSRTVPPAAAAVPRNGLFTQANG